MHHLKLAASMQMRAGCEEQLLEVPQWLADAASSYAVAQLAFQAENPPESGSLVLCL